MGYFPPFSGLNQHGILFKKNAIIVCTRKIEHFFPGILFANRIHPIVVQADHDEIDE